MISNGEQHIGVCPSMHEMAREVAGKADRSQADGSTRHMEPRRYWRWCSTPGQRSGGDDEKAITGRGDDQRNGDRIGYHVNAVNSNLYTY